MKKPTGKLAFAYATIGKLERRIDELMRQNSALAAEVERLSAFKAEVESQEPDCWRITHRLFCGIVTDKKEIAEDPFYSGCVFPLYAKPVPAEQQPAPDVSALVEALSDLEEDISDRFDMESQSTNPGLKAAVMRSRAVLATYRNQKGES